MDLSLFILLSVLLGTVGLKLKLNYTVFEDNENEEIQRVPEILQDIRKNGAGINPALENTIYRILESTSCKKCKYIDLIEPGFCKKCKNKTKTQE